MNARINTAPAKIMLAFDGAHVILERRDERLVHLRAKQLERVWQFMDLGSEVGPQESPSRIASRARGLLQDYGFSGPLIDLMVQDLMRDPWTVEEAA